MQLHPTDEAAYERARDELLGSLERWLDEQGERDVDEHVYAADLALDWKFGYGDGRFDRWTGADLHELLLEWCPRKLTLPVEDLPGVLAGIGRLHRYLDAHDLLAAGSLTPAQLDDALDRLAGPFAEAMVDTSRFGMAKSLMTAAIDRGIDLDAPGALEAWMEEFNALPEEERRRILPDSAFGGAAANPPLPPVALPPDHVRASSAAGAPVLLAFRRLIDFLGEGRDLTARGHLKIADARALVDLLATGDDVEGRRSAADLPRLHLLVRWAKTAGAVRVLKGRLVPTKKGRGLGDDPVADLDTAVDALLRLGPVRALRHGGYPQVVDFLDDGVPHYLVGPYVRQEPVAVDELVELVLAAVFDSFDFPSIVDEQLLADHLRDDVLGALELLALAGVVDIDGDELDLTPAGTHVARRLLADAGYEVPAAGAMAHRPLAEVVAADLPFASHVAELAAWVAARDPDEAAAEVVATVRASDDRFDRTLAFIALGMVPPEVAEGYARSLVGEAEIGPVARCWLVDTGLDDESILYDPDDLAGFAGVLSYRAAAGNPDELAATLALAGDRDAQLAVLEALWRVASPDVEDALEGLGGSHPDKAVAKASRKALLRHRSWMANRTQ